MADRFDATQMLSEAGPVAFRLGDSKGLGQAFLGRGRCCALHRLHSGLLLARPEGRVGPFDDVT
jgi:hypothetical protein